MKRTAAKVSSSSCRRAGTHRSPLGRLAKAATVLMVVSVGPVIETRWVPPSTTAFMLRADARAGWEGHPEQRARYRWVDWSDISPNLALAVLAAEDQHFATHWGFDLSALRYAWHYNQLHRRIRGGSTITQQTAKNLFLSPARSYVRKGLEAYFTLLLESLWPKRRILEIYLNVAQFGDGLFGAESASLHFFRKSARDLTSAEAALLAAVLPSPHRFQADHPSPFVKARRDWILRQMKQLGGASYLKSLD